MNKQIEICSEFIVGCCLNDEFMCGEITKKCLKEHDNTLKTEYMNDKKIDSFYLTDALASFELVINDVNIKINKHKEMLKPKISKDILTAINNVQELIESANVDNFTTNYNLLKIHGKLIEMADNNQTEVNFFVCENCGVFTIKKGECVHAFCQSYKKIRNLILELKAIKSIGK
ncbi:hypothetical protein A0H76_818 [Hepatospora eriocheir]|uniref:Uncharacterized protein n=1 Tax=Hepatospora eriocheir TaxID=1081669 RepID=A0A1X0QI38_9MICR|nr:hypothetical protein A0H76_818 [Hepatospora eriocheir]